MKIRYLIKDNPASDIFAGLSFEKLIIVGSVVENLVN